MFLIEHQDANLIGKSVSWIYNSKVKNNEIRKQNVMILKGIVNARKIDFRQKRD